MDAYFFLHFSYYEEQVEFDETKMPVFDSDNDDFILILYNLN